MFKGKMIVFSVNVIHAITLAKLFQKAGVKSEFIVSDVKDMITGVTISSKENERKIESYLFSACSSSSRSEGVSFVKSGSHASTNFLMNSKAKNCSLSGKISISLMSCFTPPAISQAIFPPSG